MRRNIQKPLIFAVAVGLALLALSQTNPGLFRSPAKQHAHSDQALVNAIESRRSDVLVHGSGTVIKVLADDRKGRRHQKFILKSPRATPCWWPTTSIWRRASRGFAKGIGLPFR
jgi:hypothetical protein